MSEIRIGVSACLLGEQVRYDGGHKRNPFLLAELARHVSFVPLCPEVGIGLGVPRDLDLSGFVLKKGSPSCGLERVKVWDGASGAPSPEGRGIFTQALAEALPGLPLEEEGRLNDPALREHFVDRVFGHARVRDFFSTSWSAGDLVGFHSAEKVAVMAHAPELARELGRVVADQGERKPGELAHRYRELHARAFARRATPGRQANAMMHLAGHLKASLGSADRRELRDAIEDYREGLVPVAVPLALLGRHLRAARAEWARSQSYMAPYPKQLGLRGVIAKPHRVVRLPR